MTLSRTICLDFDDTLCAHDKTPTPGVGDALTALRDDGHRLVVSSARFSPIYGDLNRFRMQTVQDWLDAQAFAVDGIALFVPEADVYVDDLGYRFSGDWSEQLEPVLDRLSPGWRSAGRRPLDKQLSVSLECIWRTEQEEPRDGAIQALERFAQLGVKVAVSAGPFLAPDGAEATASRPLRERLQAAGLKLRRVDAEKISSGLYVNPRGLHFQGDWATTLPELRARLGS